MPYRKLWAWLCVIFTLSFITLGYYGYEIYNQAPPIPTKIIDSSNNQVLFTGQDIKDGQNVWQSTGGQNVGTVWGHGSYIAPDWSADYLHRECEWILNAWSIKEFGKAYSSLDKQHQALLLHRLKTEIRTNTYNSETDTLSISAIRAEAFKALSLHYTGLFSGDPQWQPLREAYAMTPYSVKDGGRLKKLNAFFFWTAWVCGTERPAQTGSFPITYTNNWPPESLIENSPSPALVFWSIISFLALLIGISAMGWHYASLKESEPLENEISENNPLLGITPTPSMYATLKYFALVTLLFLFQIGFGAISAHYGVEGSGFYGYDIASILPFALVRTWHTQLGIFWIATAWLATGLFIAPLISGREPRFQKAGVNFLFYCLILILVGAMAGQWMAIQQKLGFEANFWFGHQGYEYVDLGRFWQIFLFVGLFVWLALMMRAIWPALKRPSEYKQVLSLFLIACVAIASFYGAGLMWGRQTHLVIAEYWRWWVVHLWVEGFFEVFATAAIAFLLVRLGLLRAATASASCIFATIIFLGGGILGTFHHLYFTGTPTSVMALGAVFSALEIVPLVFMGFEARENLNLLEKKPWVAHYRWPIYCFIAVAFWNLVGAGLFGFLINPPIALYYMQGLNTTPTHGHSALFGVYGMLGVGFILFCLKVIQGNHNSSHKLLAWAFWSINIGLMLMLLLSLLPIGLLQTWASIQHGMWYARSAEFMQQPHFQLLRWLRVLGDTVFAFGLVTLAAVVWIQLKEIYRSRPSR